MKFLSRSEEFILMAMLKLRDNAYVITIQKELKVMTDETWSLGALFVTLERMSKKGYIQSHLSKPTSERGGRRKRIYRLMPSAIDALNKARKLHTSIWQNISVLSKKDLI